VSESPESARPAILDLVLASTSPYRRGLMERLGVPFRCVAPPYVESALPRTGLEPCQVAERLARGKAESVSRDAPAATVVGADQLVSLDGAILGKPGTPEAAAAQLAALAGRSHELITAMVVIHGGRVVGHTDVTRLWMRRLGRAEIERYVARDRPVDCAGSYKLEQGGITLFERIESADQTAITGLPLISLTSILRGLGYEIP
jgi:septum formation protein